jgi:uncharacterized protein (TIGR03435 family)
MIQSQRAFRAVVLLMGFLLVQPVARISAQSPGKNAAVPTPAAAVLADVHPSPHSFAFTYFRALPPNNGRYELRQGTLLDLIVMAYGIERTNVFGGPAWLDYNRFDVVLQVPANATRDSANLALRAVLADRFHLVSHLDTKPLPALLLTSGKGEPKFKPAADTTADSGCQYQRPDGPPPGPGTPQPTTFKFQCRNITMEKYAQNLRMYSGPETKRPVVDSTGLKGAFDFDITYALMPNGRGLAYADAVEKQLGLKIAPGDAPQPVVAVDSALETPTPNPSGLEKVLPPHPQPTFEVATIKPSAPDAPRDMGIRFNGPTQVSFTSATLQVLIGFAYDISGAVVDGPDYISKQRWDIMGKIPVDTSAPQGPGTQAGYMDVGEVRLMLRSLLADRFQLTGHSDARPGDAYTLYPGSPKMKKADPANRTSCKEAPGDDGKDPRTANPNISRIMTCQNVTMTQFAAELQYYALDYVKTPVLDLSKVEGSYDLTIYWSSSRAARGFVTTAANGEEKQIDPSAVNDPISAISLPDAVAKQLGLKLVLEKRAVPKFVVDHLQETPTDN